MTTAMQYEAAGFTLPCDRCGIQARMHTAAQSSDGGESWEIVQYRNPRTKRDRDARYCEACAKEVCGIFPPVSWTKCRAAIGVLGREKEANAEIADLKKAAEEAKETVRRYLVQHDADQVSHGGYTAKLRTRVNNSFDKDFLSDVLTDEQLREATRTSESQFVVVS